MDVHSRRHPAAAAAAANVVVVVVVLGRRVTTVVGRSRLTQRRRVDEVLLHASLDVGGTVWWTHRGRRRRLRCTYNITQFLPRDAMRKRGLSRRAVSVCYVRVLCQNS